MADTMQRPSDAEANADPAPEADVDLVRSVRAHRPRPVLPALLVVGALITVVCALVIIGAWRDDALIAGHNGRTTAQVLNVSLNRTVVRFATPDGDVHSPADGVLYPRGLHPGDRVLVEYDTLDPDLVKVAGRGMAIAVLPTSMTVLITWAIIGPLLWWLRRRARVTG